MEGLINILKERIGMIENDKERDAMLMRFGLSDDNTTHSRSQVCQVYSISILRLVTLESEIIHDVFTGK